MTIVSSESDYFDMVSGECVGVPIPKYKVLIEGDSWVSHPFLSNLAIQFDNLGRDEFAILNVAIPGDTAKRMFSKGSRQLKRMGQLLHDRRFGYRFNMIFVSAAGNDIVGEEITSFVDKHLTNGRMDVDLINNEFDGIIRRISKNYKNIIELRDNSEINQNTPIVCHCYSYLKPRKVGAKIFGAMFGKGWVKQHLDKLDIPHADQQLIINTMLDRFYDALKKLEGKYDNFLVVDTREVLLKGGIPNVSLFYDEIHPTGQGFRKVAKLIRREAKSKGMWPKP